MEPLLYLAHRIPYPPNKGDKVRSFNLLKFLAARYEIHLATFVDDADDLAHVDTLAEVCASVKAATLRPAVALTRSALALAGGEPMTLRYYRDGALARWVEDTVRTRRIAKAVVFSSAMAQYATGVRGLRVVVDFCDVDSAKWTQYGRSARWPLSALYAAEGRRLLAYERRISRATSASVFVTPLEAELFRTLAPECASRVHCAPNGVDAAFFAPSHALPSPYAAGEVAVAFTGAMDYPPNADAACWFAREAFPAILAERPQASFYIVGMHPARRVRALARLPRVVVTGRVDDVRPYVAHARVVVAPLRVARGIQNKVLEAMAMARPVVVSAAAAAAVRGSAGVEFDVAVDAREFAAKTLALMEGRRAEAMAAAARARIESDYDWATNLAAFEQLLDSSPARVPAAADARLTA